MTDGTFQGERISLQSSRDLVLWSMISNGMKWLEHQENGKAYGPWSKTSVCSWLVLYYEPLILSSNLGWFIALLVHKSSTCNILNTKREHVVSNKSACFVQPISILGQVFASFFHIWHSKTCK